MESGKLLSLVVQPPKSGITKMIVPETMTIITASMTFRYLVLSHLILSLVITVFPWTNTAPSKPQIAPAIITNGT